MTVKEWVKANAKEGANFAEFEELLSAMEVPTDMTEAKAFVLKNKSLLSAFDDEVRIKIEAHDEKFKANNLPKILKEERDKIVKELNPEETPLEKRVREQDERIKFFEDEKLNNARKETLRKKAAEIGYDPIRAERYSVYGENAESMLLEDHGYMSGFVKTELEKEVKKRFSNDGQIKTGNNPNQKNMVMGDFNRLSPKDQAAFMASGGGLTQGD